MHMSTRPVACIILYIAHQGWLVMYARLSIKLIDSPRAATGGYTFVLHVRASCWCWIGARERSIDRSTGPCMHWSAAMVLKRRRLVASPTVNGPACSVFPTGPLSNLACHSQAAPQTDRIFSTSTKMSANLARLVRPRSPARPPAHSPRAPRPPIPLVRCAPSPAPPTAPRPLLPTCSLDEHRLARSASRRRGCPRLPLRPRPCAL